MGGSNRTTRSQTTKVTSTTNTSTNVNQSNASGNGAVSVRGNLTTNSMKAGGGGVILKNSSARDIGLTGKNATKVLGGFTNVLRNEIRGVNQQAQAVNSGTKALMSSTLSAQKLQNPSAATSNMMPLVIVAIAALGGAAYVLK